MRTWVPVVQLVMHETGSGETLTVGSSIAPDLVKFVSDQLMVEARENAELAAGEDPMLATLFELDREKLRKTVESLIASPPPQEPRLVPDREGEE